MQHALPRHSPAKRPSGSSLLNSMAGIAGGVVNGPVKPWDSKTRPALSMWSLAVVRVQMNTGTRSVPVRDAILIEVLNRLSNLPCEPGIFPRTVGWPSRHSTWPRRPNERPSLSSLLQPRQHDQRRRLCRRRRRWRRIRQAPPCCCCLQCCLPTGHRWYSRIKIWRCLPMTRAIAG